MSYKDHGCISESEKYMVDVHNTSRFGGTTGVGFDDLPLFRHLTLKRLNQCHLDKWFHLHAYCLTSGGVVFFYPLSLLFLVSFSLPLPHLTWKRLFYYYGFTQFKLCPQKTIHIPSHNLSPGGDTRLYRVRLRRRRAESHHRMCFPISDLGKHVF